jgi:hypothetical protein
MTLTVRSATVSGATTKGSALTHAELDENFNHLSQSSNHTFTPSGTATVSRDLQTVIREFEYSVFNTIPVAEQAAITAGTSSTDVSSYITQAVTNADGKTVYFPPGRYRVDSTVTLHKVRGAGSEETIIKKGADAILAKFLSNRWSCEGVYFSGNNDTDISVIAAFSDTTDLVQIGANDGAGGQGAGYVNAAHGIMRDVLSQGAGGKGINWLEGPALITENVRCRLNGSHGFHVDANSFDASNGRHVGLQTAFNTGAGYHCDFGTHSILLLTTNNNTGKGFYLNNGTGGFANVHAENNTGTEIHLDTSQTNTFVNILMSSGDEFTDDGSTNTIVHKGRIYALSYRADNGSVTIPAYSFNDETGFGFYRAGTGLLDLAFGGAAVFRFNANSGLVTLPSSHIFSWSSTTSATAASDLRLYRDAAATLALRNSTNAQEFRNYGTFTSTSNYQRSGWKQAKATLSAISGATVTATNLIPDGAFLLGVTTRINTGLGATNGTTGYAVGTAADPNLWGDVAAITAGTASGSTSFTATGASGLYIAAESVILTAAGGNFDGTGEIEVIAHYFICEAD